MFIKKIKFIHFKKNENFARGASRVRLANLAIFLIEFPETYIPDRQQCVQFLNSQKSGKSLHPSAQPACMEPVPATTTPPCC